MIVDIYQLHLYLNRCTGQLALETPEIPIAVTIICGYDGKLGVIVLWSCAFRVDWPPGKRRVNELKTMIFRAIVCFLAMLYLS